MLIILKFLNIEKENCLTFKWIEKLIINDLQLNKKKLKCCTIEK